jgi:TRAP-type C4-dicarboxylate transport system permease small subunit
MMEKAFHYYVTGYFIFLLYFSVRILHDDWHKETVASNILSFIMLMVISIFYPLWIIYVLFRIVARIINIIILVRKHREVTRRHRERGEWNEDLKDWNDEV